MRLLPVILSFILISSGARADEADETLESSAACESLLDQDVTQASYLVSLLRTAQARVGPPAPIRWKDVSDEVRGIRGNKYLKGPSVGEILGRIWRASRNTRSDLSFKHHPGEILGNDEILDTISVHRRLLSGERIAFRMNTVDMVKEQIVGEAAIRAFMENARANARAAEEQFRRGPRAQGPYPVRKFDFWAQVTSAGILTSLVTFDGWFASTLFAQNRLMAGSAITALALTALRPIKVVLDRIYLAGKQELVNRGLVNQDVTPLATAKAQFQFASDVLDALDRKAVESGTVMYQGFTLKTPLRFSEATRNARTRPVPTAEEIQAAFTKFDGERLPVDYREITAHQMLRYDRTLGQPVLLLKVKEIKPKSQW